MTAPPLRWTAAALTVLFLTGFTATAPAEPSTTLTPDLSAPLEIATDIQLPWGLTFLPGGDALVTEGLTDRILRIGPGREPELVRTIPGAYAPETGDGGLLGLDISPNFARDNLVYAYYTTVDDARIARFKLDSDDPPEVILTITRGPGHNGGRLKFGPDGMLYATVGDAQSSARAQDLTSLNGKILRITPNGHPAPGNPFRNSPIWSYGHRNPEGLAWDAQGRMYAAEFGENVVDEINLIKPGRNYGWPIVEGTGDTQNGRLTNPLRTFTTAEASPSGIAISGNTLYMAALRGQRLWTMPLRNGRIGEPTAYLQGVYGRLRTVEIAPDGALWVTPPVRPPRRRRPGTPLPRPLTHPGGIMTTTLVLPRRSGPRPTTGPAIPHQQLSQISPIDLQEELWRRMVSLEHVRTGPSSISLPDTRALHLDPRFAAGPPSAYAPTPGSTEFAHLHGPTDGSLHASLPEDDAAAAIEAGWAELHPIAPPTTVMLYGPRDEAELETVWTLVQASYAFARGQADS